MQTWTPNTELQNGQYIIKKVIGGGGFGETYLAEDTGLSSRYQNPEPRTTGKTRLCG